MNELFYYKEDTDELLTLGEISNMEFLSVAEAVGKEADARVYEALPQVYEHSFDIEMDPEAALRFKFLFKDWRGIVPRQIGVRV